MKIGDKTLEIQTGDLADQASGSCLLKLGDTTILSTCQIGQDKSNMGFFPLTCDYQERFYAVGKIMGSRFMRREGRPSNMAILTSRLIDRAVRPLFPKELKNEIQVISTCLSWDEESDPASLALLAASIALMHSNIPWNGPVATARIGRINNEFVINPNYKEEMDFDLVLTAIENKGDIIINMIEFQGDEISEELILKAYDFAKPHLKELIDLQKKIKSTKLPIITQEKDKELEKEIKNILNKKLEKAFFKKDKKDRSNEMELIRQEILELAGEERAVQAIDIFEEQVEILMQESILKKDKRADSRKLDEVRKITPQVGILPRTHGSSIFTRGETRALSILTLGAPGDQQLLEGMEFSGKKRFLLHYNFPPYSVGDVRPLRGPSRREIGHGMLAEKALLPLIPSSEEFPYTIRIVCEMLASNGSTSMASVSAACLALMDGGVPIKAPAAGIAIGIVTDDNEYKLLTDIQGPEDHYGGMDFKVAGTEQGITAIQMDVKIKGINREIFEKALDRAKKARIDIIKTMKKTILEPRKELSSFAPRVYTMNIDPDKIGAVIGTGGKVINEIIDECEVSIDIEDTGQIMITSENKESAEKAIQWIKNITYEPKKGEIFQAKVIKILAFGAVVEILPGKEGLVHISEFVDYRLNKVEDILKTGDIIPVKIINIDEKDGKISLSAKKAGFKPKK